MNKRELRRKCFAVLRELSKEEKEDSSEKICHSLAALPAFQSAGVVLSYISLKSEPDLSSLMWSETNKKKWGFSVVENDDRLTFRQVESPEQQLCEGDFGIREPISHLCPKIDLAKVDALLIPGVGFDPGSGARLGRGKGHYDRFLSSLLKQRKGGFGPLIIGLAFSAQLCELKPELHDVPMDCLLTEEGFIWH